MKYTLLEMTQDILSNMSSDEVNSISDTPESLQVATIIKQKYYDIVSRGDLPEHNQLFQLNPSLTVVSPVLMTIPDGIGRVEYIKYYDSNPQDNGSSQYDQYGAYSQHGVNLDLQSNANGWSTTSTTSHTIALSSVTFTVSAGQFIYPGNTATATATGTSNSMSGTVIAYSGTTLTLNITTISGSGTFSSWTITESNGMASIPGYQYVIMLPTQHFLEMVNKFDPSENEVQSFILADTSNKFPGNFTFLYKNNRQPQYCCILSNYYVIFDSYDNTQDSTLQSSKTMCFGQVVPTFQMVDTFVPDMDSQQFPLLLNEAKALAFY